MIRLKCVGGYFFVLFQSKVSFFNKQNFFSILQDAIYLSVYLSIYLSIYIHVVNKEHKHKHLFGIKVRQ